MKKVKSTALDKKDNVKGKKIKFNLSPKNLACFKGKSTSVQQSKPKLQIKKDKIAQIINEIKQPSPTCIPLRKPNIIQKSDSNSSISIGAFDQRLVFLQYQDDHVQNEKTNQKYSSESELSDDDIVSSCVRVITEETDNTSEPYSLSTPPNITPSLTPKSTINYYGFMEFYQQKQFYPQIRNKRSITTEQSRAFVIDFDKIQFDGRTTIMIKNIPNKYTQEILLSEFSVNHDHTIDFFYLPIDKDNQCNVGYAFLNFIDTSFIRSFYKEFHGKKWKKYNSAKICNLCYARYQGTLELANHFRHTKILQQKDRKLKPLIGQALKDIQEIVKNQRGKE